MTHHQAGEPGGQTPTPWHISPVRTTEDTAMIVGGAGFEFGLIADVTEDFDAAFIVKAVNSYEAMRKALEPFAKLAALAHVNHRDTRPFIFGFDTAIAQRLTIGDLREAARALALTEGG